MKCSFMTQSVLNADQGLKLTRYKAIVCYLVVSVSIQSPIFWPSVCVHLLQYLLNTTRTNYPPRLLPHEKQ